MSRKSLAPNTKKAAHEYVRFLSRIDCVDKVMLAGSRSPLREKKPHSNSDWDFIAVSDVPNLRITQPRIGNVLHSDLLVLTPENAALYKKAVEVWPNDEKKVFSR